MTGMELARTREESAPAARALPPALPWTTSRQTIEWFARPYALLDRCARELGDLFTLTFRDSAPHVFLTRPEHIREALTAPPEDMLAGEGNGILRPLLGAGSLLLLDGEKHQAQRRVVMPPLRATRALVDPAAMEAIARARIAAWPDHGEVSMQSEMLEISLEVILQAVLGTEPSPCRAPLRARVAQILELASAPAATILALRAELDALIAGEIARRRASGAVRQDVLGALVDAREAGGSPLPDALIVDQVLTMLLAGHETTATALTWALLRIAEHPEVLARIRAGDAAYLDAVCLETLRLHPVIPVISRKLARPRTIAGHELPAGTFVTPCIYLVHRRPELYPDPEAFRPERFVGKDLSPYAYLPFGGGARRCVGMFFALVEMKVVLSTVLARFRMVPANEQPIVAVRRSVTVAPSEDGRMTVTRISEEAR